MGVRADLEADATAATSAGAPRRAAPRLALRRRLQAFDAAGLTLTWLGTLALAGADHLALLVASAVVSGMAMAVAHGLYRTQVNMLRLVVNVRLLRVSLVAALAVGLLGYEIDSGITLVPVVIGAVAAAVVLIVVRNWFEYWLARARAQGRFVRDVVVVGRGPETEMLLRHLRNNPELGLRPAVVVGEANDITTPELRAESAFLAVRTSGASGAIVVANGMASDEINSVIRELVGAGIHVHLWNGLAGIGYRRLITTPMGHEPFLYVEPLSLSLPQLFAKRTLDIVVSTTLLVLSAPVLLIAAIAIKLQDRGPVFFRQVRVGRDGKPITVHKLRTMVVGAEERLDEVRHMNERTGPLFKTEADPRVTRVGKLLRDSSIDEIPQLFDVLRGDMSLVGPRPALPDEVAEFGDRLLGRLRVRPGVTGLWQVEARDNPSFESYERLDLFFVENWSILLDLAVLVNTVPAVLDRAVRTITRRSKRVPDLAVASSTLTTDANDAADTADTAA